MVEMFLVFLMLTLPLLCGLSGVAGYVLGSEDRAIVRHHGFLAGWSEACHACISWVDTVERDTSTAPAGREALRDVRGRLRQVHSLPLWLTPKEGADA